MHSVADLSAWRSPRHIFNSPLAGLGVTVSVDGVPVLLLPADSSGQTDIRSDATYEGADPKAESKSEPEMSPKEVELKGQLLDDVEWDEGTQEDITSVIVVVELVVGGEEGDGKDLGAGDGGGRRHHRGQGVLEEGYHTVDVAVAGNGHIHAPAQTWILVLPPRIAAAVGGQRHLSRRLSDVAVTPGAPASSRSAGGKGRLLWPGGGETTRGSRPVIGGKADEEADGAQVEMEDGSAGVGGDRKTTAEVEAWQDEQVRAVMARLMEVQEEAAYLRRQVDTYEQRIRERVQWHTREHKHLVFELGANDGAWIADFCERHPYFEPHIFEPQPRFAPVLARIAAKFGGRHNRQAVWITDGELRTFHSHTDEGGVGSSLFGGHAYGKCGSKVCEDDFSESYQVETVDFAAYLRRVARPHDVIILRMDIEGAEYEVARHMLTAGVACWIDYWEFEGHAMYSPATVKYRPVDAVLPWLVEACGVRTVVQDWYTEDYKVWSAWNASDNKECPLPVILD